MSRTEFGGLIPNFVYTDAVFDLAGLIAEKEFVAKYPVLFQGRSDTCVFGQFHEWPIRRGERVTIQNHESWTTAEQIQQQRFHDTNPFATANWSLTTDGTDYHG
jgi:hypothetical protein